MKPGGIVQAHPGQAGGRPAVRKCGATKRQGERGKCSKGAGWGTSHPGYGACKLHGGSTPSGIKAAAAEQAREFAVGMLGHEADVDPLSSALQAVRLAAGATAYYRVQLATLGRDAPDALIESYERAIERQARIAKTAVDAGVAERLVRIAERTAEQISLAAEEALAEVGAPPEMRREFAASFGRALARLEEAPIEGTATELPAAA